MQVRLEGPAVIPLQTGFAQNWLETTSELLTGPLYYPSPSAGGKLAAHSAPDWRLGNEISLELGT